ncbi:hypothetical protein CA267_015030 [Alteromonas pelagimontana]|uniref:Sulfotransferase family protein n=1 Tax=Alteromonas pelagimontana TaxID=1858656 RepID=A0A6M4MFM6_9ALTE|nr:hypothetical protein [Alteromonas pelagimontana]QJR81971.1 hypothetical protein CA267_015030 [Alteromonas pelagimontana]
MFVSDSLIFTELHKTAGSHIGKLLSQYVQGEQIGKHNRIPVQLRNRFVVGSIRNPWDWYVSLWGYGCDRKGSVFLQTSRKTDLRYTAIQLPQEMGARYGSPIVFMRQMYNDSKKNVRQWQECYCDPSDVDAFRRWIKLMFSPEYALDVGEGYGFTDFSKNAGLLSYRFFKLFSALDTEIYSKSCKASPDDLHELWKKQGFVDQFIRQENLEEDFLLGMEKAAVHLSDEQKSDIWRAKNNKTNTSSRKATSYYYDEETANLVLEREKFLIDFFNYRMDSIV